MESLQKEAPSSGMDIWGGNMSRNYRLLAIGMAILLSVIINFYYLGSLNKMKDVYNDNTEEVVTNLKKTFLKDTVNNLITEIDYERELRKDHYIRDVNNRIKGLERNKRLTDEKFLEDFTLLFDGDTNPEFWTVIL